MDPRIKEMELKLIAVPTRDYIVPIKPILDKKKTTPCLTDCRNCSLYINNRCLGCPVSIHYQGNLL